MHRMRVGLSGLGIILLLVVFASAGMRPERSVAPVGSEGDTLSVLGVAPGTGEQELLQRNAEELQLQQADSTITKI